MSVADAEPHDDAPELADAWTALDPRGWRSASAEDGSLYYYHRERRDPMWTLPPGVDAAQVQHRGPVRARRVRAADPPAVDVRGTLEMIEALRAMTEADDSLVVLTRDARTTEKKRARRLAEEEGQRGQLEAATFGALEALGLEAGVNSGAPMSTLDLAVAAVAAPASTGAIIEEHEAGVQADDRWGREAARVATPSRLPRPSRRLVGETPVSTGAASAARSRAHPEEHATQANAGVASTARSRVHPEHTTPARVRPSDAATSTVRSRPQAEP